MTEPSKEAVKILAETIGIHRNAAQAALNAALPIERNRWEQEVRERLVKAFETHARWAQEDADTHYAKGRDSAAPLARERERVFRALANGGIDNILAGEQPLRAIFGEAAPVERKGL